MHIVQYLSKVKMTYLQAHKRPYQRLARFVGIIIATIVVIIILVQIFFPYFFSAVFTTIARPFWNIEFSVMSGSLQSPESLLTENESLKLALMDRDIQSASILSLEDENTRLKEILGRTSVSSTDALFKQSTHGRVLAAVIKHPPATLYDEFMIDIGSSQGISTSSQVYTPGSIHIGRVSSVLSHTATVRLFSSPGEHYDVLIGSSDTPATAIGMGGGQYEAQISRDAHVKKGDYVVGASLEGRPFGVVTALVSDPTQPFETVLFSPVINIYQLRWVIVNTK